MGLNWITPATLPKAPWTLDVQAPHVMPPIATVVTRSQIAELIEDRGFGARVLDTSLVGSKEPSASADTEKWLGRAQRPPAQPED
jgi:hypothetical protein